MPLKEGAGLILNEAVSDTSVELGLAILSLIFGSPISQVVELRVGVLSLHTTPKSMASAMCYCLITLLTISTVRCSKF